MRRPRLLGPLLLAVVGLALLVGTGVVWAVAARTFAATLPLGVLAADGSAGPDVLTTVAAGSSERVELDAGAYALLLAQPLGAGDDLAGPVRVEDPKGGDVPTSDGAGVTLSAQRGGVEAGTVGSFTAPGPGTYLLEAPELAGGGTGEVLVLHDTPTPGFVGDVSGTVLGVLAGAVGLVLGIGTLTGAAVWAVLSRRRR